MEKIWIDALEFDNYGGFIRETQFVREMGQGYLLADGIGEPIEPASVRFTLAEDGWHRFFIRTKNWCVEHDPDGLILAVDGVKYNHVCSMMQVHQWYFEVGADFELKKGEHTLEVYDTTGWFGRFADIVITNDFDFTPSPEIKRWKQQRLAIKGLKNKVTDHGHFDLLIAGGGVPGVTAAITAARLGLKVVLLSDRPVLGGNGSMEGSVTLEGTAARGYHETGVVYEMKNVRQNRETNWSVIFQEFVEREPNIVLFSNMYMDQADCSGNKIHAVHAMNTLNLTEHSFTADMFIDDTGDGWLGYYAGANYRIGREAKWEHQESFAPDAADGCTMSGCNTSTVEEMKDTICGYMAEYVDHEVSYTAPSWAYHLPDGADMSRKPRYIVRGDWWLENRNDIDDLWEEEFARDSMIRLSAGYYDWLKNSWPEREKVRNLKLLCFSTFNAKRESRRLIGDYIITQNDYNEEPIFEDAVCNTGWKIDVHHPKGLFSGKEGEFLVAQKTPISQFPFRCLYSKNIDNLMMAGRCVSVTHLGLGTARVMLTGAAMAQATATAAVLCKKYGQTPREIGKHHMDELQQMLLKDGQFIPHIFNHDPADLARTARVTADSWKGENTPECVINGKTRATDGEPHAWISEGKLPQSLTLTLAEPKEIHEVRVTLEIPFDRYPAGFEQMPTLDEMLTDFTVEVQKDGQWHCVGKVENNIHRLIVIDFPTQKASAVRINALKATGVDVAMIPEVRIY